ncbi:MAG: cupin-like domain-containing protein [Pseudomonadota bacterium]
MIYDVEDLKNPDRDALAAAWNKKVVRVQHGFEKSDLFSRDALMDLIRENPECVLEKATMDTKAEDKSTWRQAALDSETPEALFEAIDGGQIWTNLGEVGRRDQRYQNLLDDLMEKLADGMAEFDPFNCQLGIIISSPNSRVFYHADVPGQALLQIQGEKTLWLYPAGEPYLRQDEFERVVLGQTAEEISYDPSFEQVATKVEFKPGQGLFWPLNWPHRVQNGPMVNVSCTIEYSTQHTRRSYAVNYTNGMMSHMFGYRPRSTETSGPAFWAKAAAGYGLRHSGLGSRLARPQARA